MHFLPINITAPTIQEPQDQWRRYLATLDWGAGNRDSAAHSAFLRAGSLKIAPEVAVQTVQELIHSAGGASNGAKLNSQQTRAYTFVGNSQVAKPCVIMPPTAVYNATALNQLASLASDVTSDWLRAASPVPVDKTSSAAFLGHLYRPGEKILVFEDMQSQGKVLFEVGKENQPLPKLTIQGAWFLVNPVDGLAHPNPRQDNKPSRRSKESITSWRYLVVESDIADPQVWLRCLAQIPLCIVAIYTSGGKSIHALVRIDAATKQEWDDFRDQIKPMLVSLGADPAAMTAVRLSRLPGALRGPNSQQLIYLDPQADGKPIISRKS